VLFGFSVKISLPSLVALPVLPCLLAPPANRFTFPAEAGLAMDRNQLPLGAARVAC